MCVLHMMWCTMNTDCDPDKCEYWSKSKCLINEFFYSSFCSRVLGHVHTSTFGAMQWSRSDEFNNFNCLESACEYAKQSKCKSHRFAFVRAISVVDFFTWNTFNRVNPIANNTCETSRRLLRTLLVAKLRRTFFYRTSIVLILWFLRDELIPFGFFCAAQKSLQKLMTVQSITATTTNLIREIVNSENSNYWCEHCVKIIIDKVKQIAQHNGSE